MILGVSGLAGSGKDTVADILVKECGCVKVSFADPLKRICKDVFQFTDDQLWGPSASRNAEDKRYRRYNAYDEKGRPIDLCKCGGKFRGSEDYRDHLPCPAVFSGPTFLTPRHALQQLGTEWGRRCYDSIWVDYALRMANALLDPTGLSMRRYDAVRGLYEAPWDVDHIPRGVVIPDVRFRNEVDGIKAVGGKVLRVVRPGSGLKGVAAQHQSETEQREMPDELFEGVIHNVGTLEALGQCVLRGWEGLTTGTWPEPGELEQQTSELITADMLMGRTST